MSFNTDWTDVYFVGIGGIGMSALARWFNVNGFRVAGYDRTPSPLTGSLQEEGIAIHFEDDVHAIPASFLADVEKTLVVYTPAVPADHLEMAYFKKNGFTIQKRSQVLGWLTSNLTTVGVAGTHGKTTTSSMVAHLLKQSGINCTAFLGGITQNYGTNFLLNEPTDNTDEIVCVVEADEFDRSFLTLFPDIAIVTSTDADHLDIYGEHNAVLESFRAYVGQIKQGGTLLMRKGLELESSTDAEVFTYSLTEGDYHTTNLKIVNSRFVFDIIHPGGKIENVAMRVPGYHNIENAVAASAVALLLGAKPEQISSGLASFKGVRRRFDIALETESKVYIDDYAHHPTEIRAFLESVRALYPGRNITAIFQPHLFSRTRDFADDFARSLALADRLLLLPIYPAREVPIEGITSDMLLKKINLNDKLLIDKEQVVEKVAELNTDILVTIGAGDIDRLVGPLKALLSQPVDK